jgi:hypothetical protein
MNVKKPLIIAGMASTVALSGVAGTGLVSAATSGDSSSQSSVASLADAIATKFNLSKSDVQLVIDQNRSEHQAERQKKFEARLEQAVKDGKLTSAQKDEVLAKEQELKSYMDSIKDKTPQERRQLMKTKLDELKTWADQNNIAKEYLPLRPGRLAGSADAGQN